MNILNLLPRKHYWISYKYCRFEGCSLFEGDMELFVLLPYAFNLKKTREQIAERNNVNPTDVIITQIIKLGYIYSKESKISTTNKALGV